MNNDLIRLHYHNESVKIVKKNEISNMLKAILSFAFILTSIVAQSDCGDDSNNLFQSANCDLDTNIAGWTGVGSQTFDSDDFNGSATSGSAIIDSTAVVAGFVNSASLVQCFDVSTDTAVKTAGAWFKSNSSTSFDCLSQVQFYEGTSCNLNNFGMCESIETQFTDGMDWTNLMCDSPILGGAVQSIRMTLTCSNGTIHGGPSTTLAVFSAKVDNVYIVPDGGLPVELMEFSID